MSQTELAVDLWYVLSDEVTDPGLLAAYRALLSDTERQQEKRFLREQVRHQFLVTRALVRTVLSAYGAGSPKQIAFSTNEYGKPIVTKSDFSWSFNLSHTEGLIVCALVPVGEVGVDVEDRQRSVNTDLAARFFSPLEAATVEAAPADLQSRFFLEFWTLKEALLKAHGTGLYTPLADFAFQLHDTEPQVEFANPALGDPQAWRFAQFDLQDRYQGAVAVCNTNVTGLQLRLRQTVPLAD